MTTSYERHFDCRKSNPEACGFHLSILQMHHASKHRDAQTYLSAKESALAAAVQPESIFPLSKSARNQNAQERIALVTMLHEKYDLVFQEAPVGQIKQWTAAEIEPERREDMEKFGRALQDVYDEQSAFDSIYIDDAYAKPGFGSEAQSLHPFGEAVDADLSGFTAINDVHAHVMRKMVEAVIDQRNIVLVDRGIMPDPVEQIMQRTGKEIVSINPHRGKIDFPDDYPADLREAANAKLDANAKSYEHIFNEGWLYAFYDGVRVAKNAELFTEFSYDSDAARAAGIDKIVQMMTLRWEDQWATYGEDEDVPDRQKAFFDGAVTAWSDWYE